ncbi:MAG: chromate resistance protein ChrB domain-containing protein [Candidatus Hydrogenedentota bacterium]
MDSQANSDAAGQDAGSWYLFLHQIPPQPQYFRVRVLRQLTRLGALPVKNSAYLLPANEDTLEDLQWLRTSIVKEGGEAWIFLAQAIAGYTDGPLRQAFRDLREPDYVEIAADARELLSELNESGRDEAQRGAADARARKLSRRLESARRIDFFGCSKREEAEMLMDTIQGVLKGGEGEAASTTGAAEYRGRRWVTRPGVKIDRIASAWLIRRFIDPAAEFAFERAGEQSHAPRELRFDTFDGEFTHEGDLCTFEVLVARFDIADPGLRVLSEIVHDIDLKAQRYERPETSGVASAIDGICAGHAEDVKRLAAGATLFDALYESFRAG